MSKSKVNTEEVNFQVGDLVYWAGDATKNPEKVMSITAVSEADRKAVCRFRNSKGDFDSQEFNFDELRY